MLYVSQSQTLQSTWSHGSSWSPRPSFVFTVYLEKACLTTQEQSEHNINPSWALIECFILHLHLLNPYAIFSMSGKESSNHVRTVTVPFSPPAMPKNRATSEGFSRLSPPITNRVPSTKEVLKVIDSENHLIRVLLLFFSVPMQANGTPIDTRSKLTILAPFCELFGPVSDVDMWISGHHGLGG